MGLIRVIISLSAASTNLPQPHWAHKTPGMMSNGLSESRLALGAETRIPPLEGLFPLPVEHTGTDLQKQMGAALAPAHLLLFHHAFAHHLIYSRFHKPGADPLTITVA